MNEIVYFSSKLVSKFFLKALTRAWLSCSQRSTMDHRPEQASSISWYACSKYMPNINALSLDNTRLFKTHGT